MQITQAATPAEGRLHHTMYPSKPHYLTQPTMTHLDVGKDLSSHGLLGSCSGRSTQAQAQALGTAICSSAPKHAAPLRPDGQVGRHMTYKQEFTMLGSW